MQLLYYDWESQKIVYSFDKDEFDTEFSVPGLRVAYTNHNDEWIYSISNWSINSIITVAGNVSQELRLKLDLLRLKCQCIHDVVRLCNIMKHRMKHESVQFLDYDPFFENNDAIIDEQHKLYAKQYINLISAAKTYDDVKLAYQDFWVATKYIDDLADVKINKLI